MIKSGLISSDVDSKRVVSSLRSLTSSSKRSHRNRANVSPKVNTKLLIHDNGGRPFKVKITSTSIDVYVNKKGKYKYFMTWNNYLDWRRRM